MSLINKMLQELDARRAETGPVYGHGEHVRVVPEPRRMHPAWWLVLVLALLLSALLAWLLLRPAAETPRTVLPLKLDIEMVPLPAVTLEEPGDVKPLQDAAPVSTTAGTVVQPANTTAAPTTIVQDAGLPARDEAMSSMSVAAARPADASARVQTTEAPKQEAFSVRPSANNERRDTPLSSSPARSEPLKPASAASTSSPAAMSKQVKELTPQQRAEEEYRKALTAIQQDQYLVAESALRSALRLDAAHVGGRQALIGILIDGGRTDEAARLAREGLVVDPQQMDLAMILARLQADQGDIKSAIQTLQRGLAQGAGGADYHALLAALYQRDQSHKKSIEHYLNAVRLVPHNGVWWMGLGISLQADGRAAEARDAFRRALATNSLSQELASFVRSRLTQLSE